MCTSSFEDSLYYCASWSYTVTLAPLLHLPPKWEDGWYHQYDFTFSSLGSNRTLIKNAIGSLPTALSRALALRAPTALLGICRSWPCATGTPLAGAVSGTNWCTFISKTILGNLHRLKCRISLTLKNMGV